jgi:biopolymer transport protein TolR
VARKKSGGVVPDMNVTPLVDVVLVLLIIFMVVAPQLEKDVPVELPGIFNPDPDVKGITDPFKVSVAKAGEYHIDDQTLDLDGLVDYLAVEHAEDPLRRLVLRADSHLHYGAIREFMGRVQEIGFPGINFMVGEKNRAGRHDDTDAAAAPEPATTPPDAPADDGAAADSARAPGHDAATEG